MPENTVGYYEKYNVTRKDGKDVSTHKFFVLDLTTDDRAVSALMYYAFMTENIDLFNDIVHMDAPKS